MGKQWSFIDWDQPRPDDAALSASWAALQFTPLEISSARTAPMLRALEVTHSNGGVVLARFAVEGNDEVVAWFAARNRFAEYGFFRIFLTSSGVREGVPSLLIPEHLLEADLQLEETWSGALTLDGELAATLVNGGAYEGYAGTANEAKQQSAAFVADLVGDRYEDFHVSKSHAAWTPWFFDIAWDQTWILVDTRHAQVTLLCVTDTD